MIEAIGIFVAVLFAYHAGSTLQEAESLGLNKPRKSAALRAEAANCVLLSLAGAVLAVLA